MRGVALSFSEINLRPAKPKPPAKIYKDQKPRQVHANSRRWVSGIIPRPLTPDELRRDKL